MIYFNRGLPGSGKSYDAIIKICEQLKKGRQVFTNIDGINFEAISEFLDIPLNRLRGGLVEVEILESQLADFPEHRVEQFKAISSGSDTEIILNKYYVFKRCGLLFCLTDDDIQNLPGLVLDNSYVVIDEIQDFFPAVTKKLSDEMTSFITQHRHRGIDILLLGQDEKDVHNLWRRRIDKLVHFTKLDSFGVNSSFKWQAYKQSIRGFSKIKSGVGKYNPVYFPLYASHVNSDVQTNDYTDDRTNLFKSFAFRVFFPLFLLLVVYSVYALYQFFHPAIQPSVNQSVKSVQLPVKPSSGVVQPVKLSPGVASETVKPVLPDYILSAPLQIQYIYELYSKYEFKLSGIAYGKKSDGTDFLQGYVSVMKEDTKSFDKISFSELRAMGFFLWRVDYGVFVQYDKFKFLVRQSPASSLTKLSLNDDYLRHPQ